MNKYLRYYLITLALIINCSFNTGSAHYSPYHYAAHSSEQLFTHFKKTSDKLNTHITYSLLPYAGWLQVKDMASSIERFKKLNTRFLLILSEKYKLAQLSFIDRELCMQRIRELQRNYEELRVVLQENPQSYGELLSLVDATIFQLMFAPNHLNSFSTDTTSALAMQPITVTSQWEGSNNNSLWPNNHLANSALQQPFIQPLAVTPLTQSLLVTPLVEPLPIAPLTQPLTQPLLHTAEQRLILGLWSSAVYDATTWLDTSK
jgi:hypothetical protein